MITIAEFEHLISQPESAVLDFKSSMYEFENDHHLIATAKFVKDVISFSNTIRNSTSYIIIGIEERDDRSKVFYGLDKMVDDAILQNKVKDKVFPRPNFHYYNITHNNNQFGILEFPVTKYSSPIFPGIKMKGLDLGKVYHRVGTTNTEALGMEAINIFKWLESLPDINEKSSLNEQILDYIKRLHDGVEPLSIVFSDIFKTARKHSLTHLEKFCSYTIKGLTASEAHEDYDEFQYRVQTVLLSVQKVSINPYSFVRTTEAMVKYKMENNKDFFDAPFLFINPVAEIEDYLKRDGFAVVEMNSKSLVPNAKKDYPVYVYIFKESFSAVYKRIRQKAIEKLMAFLKP